MSDKKGVWNLQQTRDQILAGVWKFFPSDAEFGTLYVAGNGLRGELADNNINSSTSFKQIPGDQWGSVQGGRFFLHAVKSDGTLWTWGSNSGYVTLGLNNGVRGASSPTQIPGTNWRNARANGVSGHTFATKQDNTLWTWGINHNTGNLGLNNLNCYGSPVQIPGSWTCAVAGYRFSVGLTTSGTLFSWGCAQQGALGLNCTTSVFSSPTQIPGNTWAGVYAGLKHVLAKKTDGTLWSWGGGFCTNNNNSGIGGDGTTIGRSSPVQIPGTEWVCVSAGNYTSMAIKSDGTAWVWGVNSQGFLGLNDTAARSSPVQLPGNNWYKLTSNYGSAGLKTDGSLWTWGRNNCGNLGLGNTINRSSPVQIPGTNWIDISNMDTLTMARSK